jgi:hypothetical protein
VAGNLAPDDLGENRRHGGRTVQLFSAQALASSMELNVGMM